MILNKTINYKNFLTSSIFFIGIFLNQGVHAQNMTQRIQELNDVNQKIHITQGINLNISMDDLKVVTDKSQEEIYALNPNAADPNFTGLFKARMAISAKSLATIYTENGYALKAAEIFINYRPIMYIPTEISTFACTKQNTAQHEMKHLQFEINNIKSMKQEIVNRLENFSKTKRASTNGELAKMLEQELIDIQRKIIKRVGYMHESIDSDDAYEHDAEKCPQEQAAVYQATHKPKK